MSTPTDDLVSDLRESAEHLRDGHARLENHDLCGRCSGRWPCIDSIIAGEVSAAADEIANLRRWKREAIEVIESWELVWHALGQPGDLGESRAVASLRTVLSASTASEDTP